MLALVRDLNDPCHRRNPIAVDEEQHVVPWGREPAVRRSGDPQASADLRELEMVQALVLIECVRDRSQPDQCDLSNACRIWRAHIDCLADFES